MQSEQVFKFLDKPETLQHVSFLLTKWKGKYGGDCGSSILINEGCCLTNHFDTHRWEIFSNWQDGEARFYKLVCEYKGKAYFTRDELGIKQTGNFHDEQVLSIRKQLITLFLNAKKKQMYIPAMYQNSVKTVG